MPFEREALRLLDTAYDCGIRLFDTAPLYGNGYSEVIVGKFLSKKREQIILSTKFGLNSYRNVNIPSWIALPANYLRKKNNSTQISLMAPLTVQPAAVPLIHPRKIDKQEIETSFIKSIKALKTDYIDNFLLHEAMPAFLTQEAFSFLIDLKKNGSVLKIGVASGSVNLIGCKDFDGWDILQYENGPLFYSDTLVQQFPGKHHIYHSVLKGIKNMQLKNDETFEVAAILLSYALKKNPKGKVLFASTKSKSIIKNLEALEKFKDVELPEIKSMVNALY